MLQNLFLTVVVENSACKNDAILQAQHGLSMLLDLGLGDRRVKLLWDTGATAGVLLDNAKALNIDLDHIDLIALSHGHYDHTGGLMAVLQQRKERVPVLCHPQLFAPKLKDRPSLKFIGPPFTRNQAEEEGAIILECRGPVPIAPGITATGEIPRREAFEVVEGFWTFRDGLYCRDSIPDDQSLAGELCCSRDFNAHRLRGSGRWTGRSDVDPAGNAADGGSQGGAVPPRHLCGRRCP